MIGIILATIVKLSWLAPNTGAAPDGYIIFWGSSPGDRTNSVQVGNVLSHQLDLDLSALKYLTVRPYNVWGTGPEVPELVVGKPGAARSFLATP